MLTCTNNVFSSFAHVTSCVCEQRLASNSTAHAILIRRPHLQRFLCKAMVKINRLRSYHNGCHCAGDFFNFDGRCLHCDRNLTDHCFKWAIWKRVFIRSSNRLAPNRRVYYLDNLMIKFTDAYMRHHASINNILHYIAICLCLKDDMQKRIIDTLTMIPRELRAIFTLCVSSCDL